MGVVTSGASEGMDLGWWLLRSASGPPRLGLPLPPALASQLSSERKNVERKIKAQRRAQEHWVLLLT